MTIKICDCEKPRLDRMPRWALHARGSEGCIHAPVMRTCEPRGEPTAHRWSEHAVSFGDDAPGTAWWLCAACLARVLYDPETVDGFPAQPVVVFPRCCFEAEEGCGCPRTGIGEVVHLRDCIELMPETRRRPQTCACALSFEGASVHTDECIAAMFTPEDESDTEPAPRSSMAEQVVEAMASAFASEVYR